MSLQNGSYQEAVPPGVGAGARHLVARYKHINRSHTHTQREQLPRTDTHTRQEQHPKPPNKHLPQTPNNAQSGATMVHEHGNDSVFLKCR